MTSRIRRVIEAPGRFAWRWCTGKPLDGIPRTDSTFLKPATRELDPETAVRPPGTLIAEIREDIRAFRAELRERRQTKGSAS
jgi:hypothetical protein